MDNRTAENLTSLLELPGLSNLVKGYTKSSIKVDNKYLNRKQFKYTDHKNTIKVFLYGDLVLTDPVNMFMDSKIETFTSKGLVYLNGRASYMFLNARSFNSNLSKWNVGNVTSMFQLFTHAASFNSDLSKWNVINVKTMYAMFFGAKSFNSDLSKWNVRNVEDMFKMFLNVESFNSDLSRWDVANVRNMRNMFNSAKSFNSDLSRWNVGKVESMSYMFSNAESFNSDLSEWKVENVTNMEGMFQYANCFTSDLRAWNVGKVRNQYDSFIFYKADSFDPKLSPFHKLLLKFSSSSAPGEKSE